MRGKRRQGFAVAELMVVLAIIAIVASFAIPKLMRSRMSANETGAVGSLRALISAQATYMNRHNVYGGLAALRAEGLIDDSLAAGRKSGYYFGRVDDGTCGYVYCFGACPVADGRSGTKEYCVTQHGAIYEATLGRSAVNADTGTDWSNNTDVPRGFTTTPEDSNVWTPISE